MRWTPGGTSDDIEDRRDEDDGGGGGGGFGFGGMHIGLGGVVVLFILSLVFKQNFFALLGGGTTAPVATTVHRPNPARDEAEKPLVQFVSFVLDDTQKTWEQVLPQQAGVPYRHARLVLFRNHTQSGCGGAESATGPSILPNMICEDLCREGRLKRVLAHWKIPPLLVTATYVERRYMPRRVRVLLDFISEKLDPITHQR